MTPFEYVTVLISIILGLGITQIISGVADLIHHNERVQVYWPHCLLIVLVFFLHVQEWWVIFDLKALVLWTLPRFLFVSLYPINLFILARLLFPTGMADGFTEMKKFYYLNYRKFYFFIAALAFVSVLENIFIHQRQLTEQFLQFFIFLSAVTIVIWKIKEEWIHYALTVALITVMLVSFAVAWNEYLLE